MTPFDNSAATDAELVARIRDDKSESAFRALYRRHTPHLLRTAWRLTGNAQDDAEEAVQVAWVRAIASLPTWTGHGSFASWVRGIVVHVCLDTMRSGSRFTPLFADVEAIRAPDAERIDLERAIATLPPGYRAVLVLHDVEGFTHEEVGAQLGITAGTSKGQLFKARRSMRALLDPESRRSDDHD